MHAYEEILAGKEELEDVFQQPQVEDQGVEEPTHAKTSRDGRKCTIETDKLLHDARENVGAPTSERRNRESLDRYTRYMALTRDSVETGPSSVVEALQQLVWVDGMVEEYGSIIRNSSWEGVPWVEEILVVGSS